MGSWWTVKSVVAGVLTTAAVVAAAVIWRPAIAPMESAASQSFDAALIKRGRVLAALGNCSDCHTARGGEIFAGGLPVSTPFGTIYSSNITPDPETGVGRWSETAFRRAMRSGVDRDGRHMYPTFPYDHFTNVSDEDDHALYAYLMTRRPVYAPPPKNQLTFPLNHRFVIAGWKLLFLRGPTYRYDSTRSAEWNRGAYLVEGLAHCGSCHTPRNVLGAERKRAQFAGGDVENWYAYAINSQSLSPVPWTADALYSYLRDGWHPDHGVARGPMAQVVRNLSSVWEDDVRAIATYMAGVSGEPSPDRKRRGDEALARATTPTSSLPMTITPGPNSGGAAIYAATCVSCHESSRSLPYGGVNLALSSGISGPDARNATNTILFGLQGMEGESSPIMPGFASSMSDDQLVSLLEYLRARFSDQPPWADLEKTVRDARRAQTVSVETAPGSGDALTESTQRGKP